MPDGFLLISAAADDSFESSARDAALHFSTRLFTTMSLSFSYFISQPLMPMLTFTCFTTASTTFILMHTALRKDAFSIYYDISVCIFIFLSFLRHLSPQEDVIYIDILRTLADTLAAFPLFRANTMGSTCGIFDAAFGYFMPRTHDEYLPRRHGPRYFRRTLSPLSIHDAEDFLICFDAFSRDNVIILL